MDVENDFYQKPLHQKYKYSAMYYKQKAKKMNAIWDPTCPIYFSYSLIKWHPVIEKDIVSIKEL